MDPSVIGQSEGPGDDAAGQTVWEVGVRDP